MKDEKHQGWELRLFSFPLSCLLLGLSLVKEKKNKNNLTTKNPAAPGVLHKCSLAIQLVHLLATLNSSKIRCTLSLRETAPCPAVDLPEGETSA